MSRWRKFFLSILMVYIIAQVIYLSIYFVDIIKYGVWTSDSCTNPVIVWWEYPWRILSPSHQNNELIDHYQYKIRRQKVYTTCWSEEIAYTWLTMPLAIQSGIVLTLPKIFNDQRLYTRIWSHLCEKSSWLDTLQHLAREEISDYYLIRFFAKDFFISNYYLLNKSRSLPLIPVFLTDWRQMYNLSSDPDKNWEYDSVYQKNLTIDHDTWLPLPRWFSVDKNNLYIYTQTLSWVSSEWMRLFDTWFFTQGSWLYQIKIIEEEIRSRYGKVMVEQSETVFECD